MSKHRVKALSISRPVFDRISGEHLGSRVLANYSRACNLVISEREVITLVGPAIGNGPLNIVLEETGVLEHVKPGSLAVFSDAQLVLGDSLVVRLHGVHLWNPEVNWECLTIRPRELGRNLAALCSWLSRAENLSNDFARGVLSLVLAVCRSEFVESRVRVGVEALAGRNRQIPAEAATPDCFSDRLLEERRRGMREDGTGLEKVMGRGYTQILADKKKNQRRSALICVQNEETGSSQEQAFLATARAGVKGLMQSLQDGDRPGIRESAALLAGLGPGLTPSGDDYLVGLMAGLRLWPALLGNSGLSPGEACSILLEAANGRTTLLSGAFLHSARQGLFGENWHKLLAELARGDAIGIQRAARRILSSGATSGADALAGFLSPYLYSESQMSA